MDVTNFQVLLDAVARLPKTRVSVAGAAEPFILEGVKEAWRRGLIDPVLVGDQRGIVKAVLDVGLDPARMEIVHEPDLTQAAYTSAALVANGQADVLMKGKVSSTDFMRGLLAREFGLRGQGILSHLAAYELPGYPRLLFMTDGGININPSLEQKVEIIRNAVEFLHRLGLAEPKVAILSANEVVTPKMPVTVEAETLVGLAREGAFGRAVVEGPLPMDLAVSEKAARMKNFHSKVAGQADLLVVPTIEAGNILGKTIIYLANGTMAGVVVGSRVPAVMNSRADTSMGKLVSLAMACLGTSK
ncbi:MAG: bifunctional enoyl-CoA hydratase/phosphate acetyltransferase [Syntrophomonadaceae bacterium]|nr:bifunctional enoyl-CoA hydratase/phosphate acetyltransferase [Syntrophomonadaceae bacterium]